jgi:hypothetical protein
MKVFFRKHFRFFIKKKTIFFAKKAPNFQNHKTGKTKSWLGNHSQSEDAF